MGQTSTDPSFGAVAGRSLIDVRAEGSVFATVPHRHFGGMLHLLTALSKWEISNRSQNVTF